MSNGKAVTSYKEATGKVAYNLTNDYMFKVVLQSNLNVLTALICALLHLCLKDIVSVEIMNPITPGETVGDKGFVLDIKVILNGNLILNLEMQVIDYGNWVERALSYLCRLYDNLLKGKDYKDSMGAMHIGFLDFTLFEDAPEFYATYKMLNVKNHHLYSDKFTLSVVDLSHIELATEEDRSYEIDKWAALFKATTWEELKAMGSDNAIFDEAAQTLFMLSADSEVLEQCRKAEDRNRDIRRIKEENASLKEDVANLTEDVANLMENNANLTEDVANLKEDNASLKEDNASLTKDNEAKDREIAELKRQLGLL